MRDCATRELSSHSTSGRTSCAAFSIELHCPVHFVALKKRAPDTGARELQRQAVRKPASISRILGTPNEEGPKPHASSRASSKLIPRTHLKAWPTEGLSAFASSMS